MYILSIYENLFFGIFFYENPKPGALFFVYVKLLISLLNGAFFRLGDNFSVRGYGARFSAGALQQLFKLMVGTPYGFCCAAGLGKEKLAKSIFWYFFYENPNPGATFFVY